MSGYCPAIVVIVCLDWLKLVCITRDLSCKCSAYSTNNASSWILTLIIYRCEWRRVEKKTQEPHGEDGRLRSDDGDDDNR